MFPKSTLFHYPILRLLSDGNEHTQRDFRECVITHLEITQKQQQEKVGGRNKLTSWINFAVRNLRDAGFLVNVKVGVYKITKAGKDFYEANKNGFVYTHSLSKNRGQEIGSTSSSSSSSEQTSSTTGSNSIEEGYVYILTNPAFKDNYIKIGFTSNIDERLDSLYNTSVPRRFKIYALLKTKKYKDAELMMHERFKGSRIGEDREFFLLIPDVAFEFMKVVAKGLEAEVFLYDDKGKVKKTFDFRKNI